MRRTAVHRWGSSGRKKSWRISCLILSYIWAPPVKTHYPRGLRFVNGQSSYPTTTSYAQLWSSFSSLSRGWRGGHTAPMRCVPGCSRCQEELEELARIYSLRFEWFLPAEGPEVSCPPG